MKMQATAQDVAKVVDRFCETLGGAKQWKYAQETTALLRWNQIRLAKSVATLLAARTSPDMVIAAADVRNSIGGAVQTAYIIGYLDGIDGHKPMPKEDEEDTEVKEDGE